MKFIKENGGTIVVGGVALAVLAAFADWRIGVKIDEALSSQDLATDANIVAIRSNIQSNTRTGEENAEDIEQNRERVEAAFAALLGRQPD